MNYFLDALNNKIENIAKLENLNIVDVNGKTLLEYAILGNSFEVIRYLLSKNININKQNYTGETVLFTCARKSKLEIAKILIKNNINIDLKNKQGETCLHLACFKGDLEFVKLLIENKADKNILTDNKQLPIHYLALGGHHEKFKEIMELLDNDYFILDEQNNSLLHYACKNDNLILVNFLLNKGLDPNHINSYFENPIFNAVKNGNLAVTKLLIKSNTLLSIINRKYETLLDTAIIYNQVEITNIIKETLDRPLYKDFEKDNILTLAVLNRDYDKLQQLVDQKYKLKKNNLGKSALDYARLYKLRFAVSILNNINNI